MFFVLQKSLFWFLEFRINQVLMYTAWHCTSIYPNHIFVYLIMHSQVHWLYSAIL
jgi:hypothetical protein